MFKKDKYVIIRQAISKELAVFIANYFSIKKQVYDTCRKTKYISPYETLLLNNFYTTNIFLGFIIRMLLWAPIILN